MKTLRIAKALVAMAAVGFAAASSCAESTDWRYQTADGDGDYLTSNEANWEGNAVPTSNLRFNGVPGVVTFDNKLTISDYIWVGTTGSEYDSDWLVWKSKGGTTDYGFEETASYVRLADALTQKARLRILSGAYKTPKMVIGANGGTAYFEQKGGTFWTTGDFRVASDGSGATQGTADFENSALTVGSNIAVGTENGMTGSLSVSNTPVNVSGVVYVGRTGGTGTLTVEDGANVASLGDLSFGSKGGTGYLTLNGGELHSKFWFTTGRDDDNGQAYITINGGTLSTAYYDGSAHLGWTANGVIDLSGKAGTYTRFVQNGGYVQAVGSANDGEKKTAMLVSNNDSASADVILGGGEMYLDGTLDVGRYGTGTFTMTNGTLTATRYMRLGFGNGSTGVFTISNGVATIGGDGYGFILGDNANSTATLNIDGGTSTFTEDSFIGYRAPATMNVNGGTVSIGTASVHKWLKFDNEATVAGTSVLNLNGGVLDICSINVVSSSGNKTQEINFDGGTIHAYANNGAASGRLIQAADSLSVYVKEHGGTVEVPGGISVSLAEPLLAHATSTGGGFTKTGAGTLTLASGNTYTGATSVEEGVLVVSAGDAFAGGIEIAEGALLLVDVSGLELTTESETAIGLSLTLPDGVAAEDCVGVRGRRAILTFTQGEGNHATVTSARLAGETEGVRTFWVGGSDTAWGTAANWSQNAVPGTDDTICIFTDSTINRSDAKTIAGIDLIGGAALYFYRTGGDPTTFLDSISGEGTLKIMHGGLSPSTQDLVVGEDITIKYMPYTTDSWIQENGGFGVIVHGAIDASEAQLIAYSGLKQVDGLFTVGGSLPIRLEGTTTTFNGPVKVLADGSLNVNVLCNFNGGMDVEAGGTVSINANDTVFAADTVVKGAGTINFPYRATVNANLEGALTLNLTGWSKNGEGKTYFGGRNENFTGYLNSSSPYHNPYFTTPDAGSAQARFNFVGDVRTKFASGTIKFGEARFTKNDWCVCYIDDATSDVIFEIGALGTGNDFIGDGYSFGSNKDKLTIRKVGDGLMESYGDQYQNLDLRGGVFALKDRHCATSKFYFNGGTLKLEHAFDWQIADRFDFANSTGPIDIDTAGNDFTWTAVFSGDVGLTKRGAGALALTSAPTYTGATTVIGGTLVLPYRTFASTVTVAENARLTLDASGMAEVTENEPVQFISVAIDAGTASRIAFAGSGTYGFAVTRDGTTGTVSYTATALDPTTPNNWIGGASGYWNVAGNWSRGIPQSSHQVVFSDDAFVWVDASKSVGKLVVNGTVKFRSTTGHPEIQLNGASGTGTIQLWHVGLASNGQDADIDSTLTLEYLKVNDANDSDSWLNNKDNLLNIYAPLTGEGFVRIYKNTRLYGDNSGFTGRVRKDDDDVRFMTPESGLPNATEIELYGTLWLWFTEGTITFGGQMTMSASGNRGINMPSGVTDVKLVVGNNDGNVTMNGSKDYQFYTQDGNGWTAGCANATLRKVGTGTMTCRVVGAYNLEANGGTTTIAVDDPDAVVSVASGAAITAGNVSVASLDMAAGSVFAPVVTYTAPVEAVEDDPETDEDESVAAVPATSTISPLTVVGAANVGGMVVRVDEPEKLLADNAYTLISAGAANGVADRIVVDADGSKIVAKNGEIWLAKRSDNNVVMRSGKEHPGFILVVQ